MNDQSRTFVEWNGKVKSLLKWSEDLDISYVALYHRLFSYRWSVEKAFTTPVKKQVRPHRRLPHA